ncbi:uncharacterized protein BT62DRAFT_1040190 [Guyanagaster necrorhizus]|uniref:ubiquitinyl hydrolase 1 n=1 Tax=Guyanagaster necrorhizus TaxID=856835 RepID=A0A9P8AZ53_9AGAR|nr:uncharacterized protein BT62DRAFT_1040190 [Guyanagaster necrorhizus MCA 3950]KAG7451612.1 hypothetical protein BT62DRAFT_1040190 [Guyanagaster necrorhizus MCA 3950]
MDEEETQMQFLSAMMGSDFSTEVARRVLRKHNGSAEKAAEALLAGDNGEDDAVVSIHTTGTTQPAVIDLTSDDSEEVNRAIRMSLNEDESPPPKFGPSNRAPDPAWQVVASNVSTSNDAQMEQAIQNSLEDFAVEDDDHPSVELAVREGGRPVAIRPEISNLAYAALILQALYYVPQIRRKVSEVNLDSPLLQEYPVEREALRLLRDMFVHQDLAQLSIILDQEVLQAFRAQPIHETQKICEYSLRFYGEVMGVLTHYMRAEDPEGVPLGALQSGTVHIVDGKRHNQTPHHKNEILTPVYVEYGWNDVHEDLVQRLSLTLMQELNALQYKYEVIVEPAPEVVAFVLKNEGKCLSPPALTFPKTIYMDRFLNESTEFAHQKQQEVRDMQEAVNKLWQSKQALTQFNNKDTLKDLRTTLYYYEEVAQAKDDDPDRRARIDAMVSKLRNSIGVIEKELEVIDMESTRLLEESQRVLDCPELKNHPYDLRAVLMHDGLPGRKHVYLYVQDAGGIWWKTVDTVVTEVPEEDVFRDTTGMLLGAGPYMLLYSRSLSKEELEAPVQWPRESTELTEMNNKTFLDSLPPEIAARARPRTGSSIDHGDMMDTTA